MANDPKNNANNTLQMPTTAPVPVSTGNTTTAPIAPANATGTPQPAPTAKKGLGPKATKALEETVRKIEEEKKKLAPAAAAAEASVASPSPFPDEPDPPSGPRYKALIRVRIAEKEFSNLNGDFLGMPRIVSSSRQYANARFTLNDPDGSIFESINDKSEVFIQIGFADGEKRTKFKGKVFSVGRTPPDGTVVVAVDPSMAMAGATNSASSQAEKPPAPTITPIAAAGTQASDGSGTKKGLGPHGKKLEEALAKARANLPAAGAGTAPASDTKPSDPLATQTTPAAGSEAKPDGAKPADGATATPATPTTATTTPAATTPAPAPPAQAASTDPLAALIEETTQEARASKPQIIQFPTAERLSAVTGMGGQTLKFANDSKFDLGRGGEILLQMSKMNAATMKAIEQGDIVLWDGDKLKQVGPGQGTASGLVLDYSANRAVFANKPEFLKRSPLQLSSGAGALTVLSPDLKNKTTNGATVVTQPGAPPLDPNIKVPGMNDIKLGDPIFPGCRYTWADAFLNGERMPETQEVVAGVVEIAQALEKWSKEYIGTARFEITSWYRSPAVNMAVASSGPDGPHTSGSAVDFYFDDYPKLHEALRPETAWPYGVAGAYHPGSMTFLHVDCVKNGPRRWEY